MKALHYQTQKEQKNLEERLAQEEVGKKGCNGQPRSQEKPLGTRLYSGANFYHKVGSSTKSLMKTVRERAAVIEPGNKDTAFDFSP